MKKCPPVASSLYEARADAAKVTTYESLSNLRDALKSNSNTKRCGLVQLLQGYDQARHANNDTEFGLAPFGSCLVYQQRGDRNNCVPQSWMFGEHLLADATGSKKTALKERTPETLELYKKRLCEGYNMPPSFCPDYYD